MTKELNYTIGLFDANTDDPASIAAQHLCVREWQVANGKNTFTNILDSQSDLHNLEDYYVASGGNFFVARMLTNQVIGFVGLHNEARGYGSIKRMAVLPEHQAQGVGSALMTCLLNWSRQAGLMQLDLITSKQEDGRNLYERFGFKIVGDHGYKNWAMQRKL